MRLSPMTQAGVRTGAERTMDFLWYRWQRVETEGAFGTQLTYSRVNSSLCNGRYSPVKIEEVPMALQEATLNRRVFRFMTTGAGLNPGERVGNAGGTVMFEILGDMDPPTGQTGVVVRSFLVAQVAGN